MKPDVTYKSELIPSEAKNLMRKNKGILTLKIFTLIVMTDVLESIAELFFKRGSVATGIENIGISHFLQFTLKIISIPNIWIGVFFYALNFFLWILVLSKVDLSAAFPAGSTTYVIVPILSIIFLHEKVAFTQWVGIILIAIGTCFISQSTRPEKVHEP